MEPHTNANEQDFTCIVIIQFPTNLPYKQIQYLYAKVTTDCKKSPVYFNLTSPRVGRPARQGDGTLQCTLQSWYTEALPERSSDPFLVVWLSFLQKQKKWKKKKGIHQTHTTGTFYPHKKAALQFSLALETSILISTFHSSPSPSSVLKTSPPFFLFYCCFMQLKYRSLTERGAFKTNREKAKTTEDAYPQRENLLQKIALKT